jgi:hypothetical protein
LLDQLPRSEKGAICIGENDIFLCHCKVTEMGGGECFWIAWDEPLGPRWIYPATEDGKTNLYELQSISMATPNDNACQSTGLSFQGRQISYATFIHPSTIVDYENVPLLRRSHYFQEDIYAAIVSHWQNSASNMISNGC